MAIFSEFMRVYRQAEQTARAGGGRLSEADMAGLSGMIGQQAGAETEGRIAQSAKEQSLEDIAASRGRFTEGVGLGRDQLALTKERHGIAEELGRAGLKADKRSRRHMGRQAPWALGLGAVGALGVPAFDVPGTDWRFGGIETGVYGAKKQKERDQEYRRLLDRLIKGRSGGASTDTGRVYTPNPQDRRNI